MEVDWRKIKGAEACDEEESLYWLIVVSMGCNAVENIRTREYALSKLACWWIAISVGSSSCHPIPIFRILKCCAETVTHETFSVTYGSAVRQSEGEIDEELINYNTHLQCR